MFFPQQNLFQPAQRQIDIKKEKQREMERAFERPFVKRSGMYVCTNIRMYVRMYIQSYLYIILRTSVVQLLKKSALPITTNQH